MWLQLNYAVSKTQMQVFSHNLGRLRASDPSGAKEYARTVAAVPDPRNVGFDVEAVLTSEADQQAA